MVLCEWNVKVKEQMQRKALSYIFLKLKCMLENVHIIFFYASNLYYQTHSISFLSDTTPAQKPYVILEGSPVVRYSSRPTSAKVEHLHPSCTLPQ